MKRINILFEKSSQNERFALYHFHCESFYALLAFEVLTIDFGSFHCKFCGLGPFAFKKLFNNMKLVVGVAKVVGVRNRAVPSFDGHHPSDLAVAISLSKVCFS